MGLEKPKTLEDIHASRLSRVVAGCSAESSKMQRSSTDYKRQEGMRAERERERKGEVKSTVRGL